jgi:hypothetical protein
MSGRLRDSSELFRALNERIIDLGVSEPGVFDLVCECGDDRCAGLMPMAPSDYQLLRSDSAQFGVLPGHERLDTQVIVADRRGFVIVKKLEPGQSNSDHEAERTLADTARVDVGW